jgi:hypothetical protein
MPLAILAVAGGIALVASRQRDRQRHDVQALVESICRDVLAGRGGALPAPQVMRDKLRARLEAALAAAGGDPSRVQVEVRDGDDPAAGSVPAEATHTAVIRVDGRDVLVLRLLHPGGGAGAAIIGFRVP